VRSGRPAGVRPRRFAPIAFVLVLVAGCAGPGAPPATGGQPASSGPPAGSEPADVEGPWALVAGTVDGNAIPLVDGHPITIRFDGTEVGGTAACNSYGGRVTSVDARLTITDLGMTDMACEAAVMAAESAYIGALVKVTRIAAVDDELILDGDDVAMRFERLPLPPTADLVDTVWRLDSVFVGDVASSPLGEPATLELRSDGSLHGSTGCRTFDGTWIEAGEQIDAPTLRMNEAECPAELAAQDSHVTSVIGDGFVPTIADGLLTLVDPGGVGLVYRAGE